MEENNEDLFGAFKFIDDQIPEPQKKADDDEKVKKVSKKQTKDEKSEEELEAIRLEAEEKALLEAKRATEKAASKKQDNPDESDEEFDNEDFVDNSNDNSDDESGTFKEFAKHMSDKGILDFDEETFKDEDDSEELLEKVVEKTVENKIKEWKGSYPEDAQKFLEFVENGGNPADFHKYYYKEVSFKDYDLSTEESAKAVIKLGLEAEGYSSEEIDEELEDIERLGTWEKKAKLHLKKLQKIEDEQKEAIVEAQKKYAKEQEELSKKQWEDFKKGLYDRDSIGGFKLTNKLKDEIWDYMTKPIDKKTGITAYQKDSQENEDARYMFAYLLKNKWNIKSLEKQITTKEVSKLRSKLSNYTDKGAKMKSHLSDRAADSNGVGFSAFKEYLNQ